jgi:hypothetical protein
MMKSNLVALFSGLITMMSLAGAVAAKEPTKLMALRVEGLELTAPDKEALNAVLVKHIEGHPNYTLIAPPKGDLTDLMIELECFDMDTECLSKVGKAGGADQILYTQVDKKRDGFELKVILIGVAKQTTERKLRTKVKKVGSLSKALKSRLGKALVKPTETSPPEPVMGKLVIVADATAQVFIDDKLAGTGRLELDKAPGSYKVRVVREGFEAATYTVKVQAGVTATQQVVLKAVAVAPKPQPKPEPKPKAEAKPTPKPKAEPKPEPKVERRPTGQQAGEAKPLAVVSEEVKGAQSEPEFYKTWWFWTAVGSVLAAGVATGVALGAGAGGGATGTVNVSLDSQNLWRDVSLSTGGSR